MELKDVILSTLAEMEDDTSLKAVEDTPKEIVREEVVVEQFSQQEYESNTSLESELIYLNSIRERLLVLFEGFQAPNNANIEAKVDMTLNFLEYTLATIDARVQKLEKGNL
ncbi:CiaD-like domain-containing protein [Sulfurimonas sp.]